MSHGTGCEISVNLTYRDKINELRCKRFARENRTVLQPFYSIDKLTSETDPSVLTKKVCTKRVNLKRKNNIINEKLQDTELELMIITQRLYLLTDILDRLALVLSLSSVNTLPVNKYVSALDLVRECVIHAVQFPAEHHQFFHHERQASCGYA